MGEHRRPSPRRARPGRSKSRLRRRSGARRPRQPRACRERDFWQLNGATHGPGDVRDAWRSYNRYGPLRLGKAARPNCRPVTARCAPRALSAPRGRRRVAARGRCGTAERREATAERSRGGGSGAVWGGGGRASGREDRSRAGPSCSVLPAPSRPGPSRPPAARSTRRPRPAGRSAPPLVAPLRGSTPSALGRAAIGRLLAAGSAPCRPAYTPESRAPRAEAAAEAGGGGPGRWPRPPARSRAAIG